MSDHPEPVDATAARHQHARTLAEQAVAAQAEGEDERADALFAEASKIDADAVANVLAEAAGDTGDTATGSDAAPQDDDELASMSTTVVPGSGAPSRSGISGRGSGADGE